MNERVTAYIGLGSNLGNPRQQVLSAIEEISQLANVALLQASSLYQTAPIGPPGQQDYINAVISVQCQLSAEQLLAKLQQIESQHKRQRDVHWGPRTLDLDILLFGNLQIAGASLTIPHPHMQQRRFVLDPLCELAPQLQIPGLGSAKMYLDACLDQEVLRLP